MMYIISHCIIRTINKKQKTSHKKLSTLKFNSHKNTYTLLVFKGDVRSRIEVNNRVTLHFKIVPLIDCFEYEALEIVRKWEDGVYPTIDDYLTKKN